MKCEKENSVLVGRKERKRMKVLSLFDGISCGMIALARAGILVERYVAYEIDENAQERLQEVLSAKEYQAVFDSGNYEIRWKFLEYFK